LVSAHVFGRCLQFYKHECPKQCGPLGTFTNHVQCRWLGEGGGGSRFKLARPSDPEGGPTMLRTFLSFPVVSLSVDWTNWPFRPSQSHSATESLFFRFCVKIFSRSVLAWGGGGGCGKKIHPGPEPALGGPEHVRIRLLRVSVTPCKLLCRLPFRRPSLLPSSWSSKRKQDADENVGASLPVYTASCTGRLESSLARL
jgi:hypothetical protein